MINVLSVDVEEYYHGREFEAAVPEAQRPSLPSRVEASVDRVLELLTQRDVRATFFVVGRLAADHPGMVQRIVAQGHELACHGHEHELVFRQSPQEFRDDVTRAKALLEDLSGEPVVGYRAPNFSIGAEQDWAYDILLENGFLYDSSSYPILHDRYGTPGDPRFPYEVRRSGESRLLEFPVGTARFAGINFPIGGGGYFRLLPFEWTRRGIMRVNGRERQPVMFYFHPWELDPDQPRPPMPWHHRMRHFVNLERMESKLHQLLQCIRFAPARHVLDTVTP